jgi:hypothetical protein
MNFAPRFLPVGLSLKRWSMVFILVIAAIYGVMPGAARADFTMQYTGAAFDTQPFNSGFCGPTTNPVRTCLVGRLTMSFEVQGDPPGPGANFCLSLAVLGQPNGDCLTVLSGTIQAGGVVFPLVGDSKDMATFTSGVNFWHVSLDGLSTAPQPTGLSSGKTHDLGGDTVVIRRVGRV